MPRELILRTPRLRLTTWKTQDVDDLAVVHADPETMRYIRRGIPESPAQTAELIDEYIAAQATLGYTKWRLTDHHDQLVGRAGFSRHDGPGGGRELSYTIRRDQWGLGLATEIAAALLRWHRSHAPDEPLYAYVALPHSVSRHILTKVGFTSIGFTEYGGVDCEFFAAPTS